MNFDINLDFWIFGVHVSVNVTPAVGAIVILVVVLILYKTIAALF